MTFRPATLVDKWGVPFFQGEIEDGSGGSQPQFLTIGPVPVTFESAGLNSTGVPICDVLEGDIVCGWGGYCTAGFDGDGGSGGQKKLYVGDNTGVVCVNGGQNLFSTPSSGDSAARTLDEVFDGWTLILADTTLVLAQAIDPGFPDTQGAIGIYVTVLRPVAP